MKTEMYQFDAIYKDESKNNHMTDESGNVVATEVRFHIIAESEERALKLIEKEGENPDDFQIDKIGLARKEMGRFFFNEAIFDGTI